ncbi:MAG: universal stress protein [Anaerolineae bacterium]
MRLLIVLAADGHNEGVLRFGTRAASRLGAPDSSVLLAVADRPIDRARAEAELSRAGTRLTSAGISVQAVIRVGDVGRAVAAEVDGGSPCLAVLGDLAERRWRPYRDGASRLADAIEATPCHVAVVRGDSEVSSRILLCDSGVPGKALATRFARDFAGLADHGDRITVLHVMSQMAAGPGAAASDLRADAADLMVGHAPEGEILERGLGSLENLDAVVTPKVRHGMVVDEILAEAKDGDYGLVVIGAFGSGLWRRLLLDDLSRRIVERIDRPLLVVR